MEYRSLGVPALPVGGVDPRVSSREGCRVHKALFVLPEHGCSPIAVARHLDDAAIPIAPEPDLPGYHGEHSHLPGSRRLETRAPPRDDGNPFFVGLGASLHREVVVFRSADTSGKADHERHAQRCDRHELMTRDLRAAKTDPRSDKAVADELRLPLAGLRANHQAFDEVDGIPSRREPEHLERRN